MALRRIIRQFYRYLPILFVFMLLFTVNAHDAVLSGGNLITWGLCSFGGINLAECNNFFLIITTVSLNILFIYVFSDFMKDDFVISYAYVFTRMGKMEKWFRILTLRLLGNIVLLYGILELSGILTGLLFGLKVSSFGVLLRVCALSGLLNILVLFCISLVQNILSLKLGSSLSFLLAAAFYVVSFLLPLLWPDLAAVWRSLLPVNQMYLMHSDRIGNLPGIEAFGQPIRSFTVLFSAAYTGAISLAAYIISAIIIKKSDTIAVFEEAV